MVAFLDCVQQFKEEAEKGETRFAFLTGQYSPVLNEPKVGPKWAEWKGQ